MGTRACVQTGQVREAGSSGHAARALESCPGWTRGARLLPRGAVEQEAGAGCGQVPLHGGQGRSLRRTLSRGVRSPGGGGG